METELMDVQIICGLRISVQVSRLTQVYRHVRHLPKPLSLLGASVGIRSISLSKCLRTTSHQENVTSWGRGVISQREKIVIFQRARGHFSMRQGCYFVSNFRACSRCFILQRAMVLTFCSPSFWVSWFLGFLVSGSLGFRVSWFLGFWVSWFLGFLVSQFLGLLVSGFLGFWVSWFLFFWFLGFLSSASLCF